MIDLQIALTAFIVGVAGWIGVYIFDQADWEGTATVCAVITVICGLFFVASIIVWFWSL